MTKVIAVVPVRKCANFAPYLPLDSVNFNSRDGTLCLYQGAQGLIMAHDFRRFLLSETKKKVSVSDYRMELF